MESVCVLLTLAVQEGWRVHHMDVKSAFLNANLKEEVYVRNQPASLSQEKRARCNIYARCCTGSGRHR